MKKQSLLLGASLIVDAYVLLQINKLNAWAETPSLKDMIKAHAWDKSPERRARREKELRDSITRGFLEAIHDTGEENS